MNFIFEEMDELIDQYRGQVEHGEVVYLDVKVIPKARRTEFVEVLLGGEGERVLKIKVAAVPEKGKANAELCRFIAGQLEVVKSRVSVVQGKTSSRKVVKVVYPNLKMFG